MILVWLGWRQRAKGREPRCERSWRQLGLPVVYRLQSTVSLPCCSTSVSRASRSVQQDVQSVSHRHQLAQKLAGILRLVSCGGVSSLPLLSSARCVWRRDHAITYDCNCDVNLVKFRLVIYVEVQWAVSLLLFVFVCFCLFLLKRSICLWDRLLWTVSSSYWFSIFVSSWCNRHGWQCEKQTSSLFPSFRFRVTAIW